MKKLPLFDLNEHANYNYKQFIKKSQENNFIDLTYLEEEFLEQETVSRLLQFVFLHSPFLSKILIQFPELIYQIHQEGFDKTLESLQKIWEDIDYFQEQSHFMQDLRVEKKKLALLVALADIAEAWSLEKVTLALSQFADKSLDLTIKFLLNKYQTKFKLRPDLHQSSEKNGGFCVIAMGKLGGNELNYSSDVDLIIFYDPEKLYEDPQQHIDAQKHMVTLTRNLVEIMQERTKDGYVFRVDLRLRPDPSSTPLAIHYQSGIDYYFSVGQNWERAAMVKARACAGDLALGQKFLDTIQPYIWREYLDFWSIRDTHAMKRQINFHHSVKSDQLAGLNVKLGPGGIREIEFFIQTEQLIWGGKNPKLRTQETCIAFKKFADEKLIEPHIAQKLQKAYRFLRKVEHRLQMVNDLQTHKLPTKEEEFDIFSLFMGYEHTANFRKRLEKELNTVKKYYAGLFEQKYPLSFEGNLVFTGVEKDPETTKTLLHLGFMSPETVQHLIPIWHHGRYEGTKSMRARQILTDLVPILLDKMGHTANPDLAFVNFDRFLQNISEGEYFFSFLNANLDKLDLFIQILGSAPKLANHLTKHIHLFDQLVDPSSLKSTFDKNYYDASIQETLSNANDYENQLEALRLWKKEQKFIISILFFQKKLTLEKTLAAYSYIAENCVLECYKLVEKDFFAQHGRLNPMLEHELLILSYGKLGAEEMTPTSDLDLVFIAPSENHNSSSNGPSSLSASQYRLKLAQKFINAVEQESPNGKLYQVDLRLRPHGDGGSLVITDKSWKEYLDKEAWMWEILATTRGRVLIGPEKLSTEIAKAIYQKICSPYEVSKLQKEISYIKVKINQSYTESMHPIEKTWKLKYAPGGVLDTEFLIQYLFLLHADKHPEIYSQNTKTVFKKLAEKHLITQKEYQLLASAHKLWLTIQTFCRLTAIIDVNPETMPKELKKTIAHLTNCEDFDELLQLMSKQSEQIQSLMKKTIGIE